MLGAAGEAARQAGLVPIRARGRDLELRSRRCRHHGRRDDRMAAHIQGARALPDLGGAKPGGADTTLEIILLNFKIFIFYKNK